MLPQWSLEDAHEYLERCGWEGPKLDGPSLLWTYLEVGDYLLVKCGKEVTLYRPGPLAAPLSVVSDVLLYRQPIPLSQGFPALWRELNAFYGREMAPTEYEAIALLENGRLSPTLEALCQAQLPKGLPEPLNRIYRDWEVRRVVCPS